MWIAEFSYSNFNTLQTSVRILILLRKQLSTLALYGNHGVQSKAERKKKTARIQLTRNNFATEAAANHFYPGATNMDRGTSTGGGEHELERRLKLDLLISTGNVAARTFPIRLIPY